MDSPPPEASASISQDIGLRKNIMKNLGTSIPAITVTPSISNDLIPNESISME